MRWTVHGERIVYDSPWVRLSLADVELPGGVRFEHHVVRAPREASGVIVANPASELLLLWRHRFITDTWGWEIPAGAVDDGETAEQAACREVLEETGWQVSSVERLGGYFPMNGVCDQRFNLFLARDAEYQGPPTDSSEAERVEWVSIGRVREAAVEGEISDGLTLTALTLAFTLGVL